MTLARGRTLEQQHQTYLAVKAGRIMRGWSQAQMAELMAEATGSDEWTENRITAIENGRKIISDGDLRVFAELQGYDVSFYWYGPAPHVKPNREKPLSLQNDPHWNYRDNYVSLPNESWWTDSRPKEPQRERLPLAYAR